MPTSEAESSPRSSHRCASCPRDGEPRLRQVENAGAAGLPADHEPPPPYVLETVWLCDSCALTRDDVL